MGAASHAKRIQADYRMITTQPPDGVRLVNAKELTTWEVEIDGPIGTVWEGGVFKLQINFTEDYPFKPPKVKFTTRIYHPNVNEGTGGICLDLLFDRWLPSYHVGSLLVSIRSFLDDPNPEHGLNADALEAFRRDKPKYQRTVKEYVAKYARR